MKKLTNSVRKHEMLVVECCCLILYFDSAETFWRAHTSRITGYVTHNTLGHGQSQIQGSFIVCVFSLNIPDSWSQKGIRLWLVSHLAACGCKLYFGTSITELVVLGLGCLQQ